MPDDTVEILLVEDNPKDLELTLHALKKHHLANAIHVARDGAEALEFFFGPEGKSTPARKPKLILLDLKLPKVSGVEFLRQVKKDPRTQAIPVVVLTSSTQDRDIKECYALGVNSYLQKPVDFGQFVEVARSLGLYWLLMNRLPPEG